jgi:hypothetical protein
MKSPFKTAEELASQGKFQEACEVLFGKDITNNIVSTNSLTLHESDGAIRSFKVSKEYWQKQGMRMMRLEDLYRLLGSLTKKQLSSLRNDMKKYSLHTSHMEYKGMMLSVDGRKPVACPVHNGVRIQEVDEALLQNIFNTEDSKDAIIQKLSAFSGVDAHGIIFWTASQYSRRDLPSRVASLNYYFGQFRIIGSNVLDNCGYSRGVSEAH